MDDTGCAARVALQTFQSVSAAGSYVFMSLLFLASLLGTPALMWLYRRRVVKLMSERDDADVDAPVAAVAETAAPAAPVSAAELVAAADARTRRLRTVLIAACAVFTLLAGLLVTLSPAGTTDASTPPLRGTALLAVGVLDVVMVGALCMPIVLLGLAHPQFTRLYWRRFAPLFLGAAALRFAVAEPGSFDAGVGAFGATVLFGAGFVVLFYLAIARRHARQVAPVLAVLLAIVFVGVVLAAMVGETSNQCMVGDIAGLPALLALIVPFVFVWLAWRGVLRLGLAYERKALSDAQVQTGCWMLLLTMIVLVTIVGAEEAPGPWLPALGVVAVASFATYVLGIRRLAAWPRPQGLLLLRVFAQDERGEHLLDETAFRWRFVGPIHMIGGPDMAQQTLDPYELLLFVRGRARDQFVTTRAQLVERLAALDEATDPDGRYRVNEFFCFDNVWQAGVEALLGHSRAVLLDLRGFTAQRRGTAFEIGLLARHGALTRTVCLVDDKTDLAAVNRTIAETGQGALDATRVLPAGQGLDARQLFAALADAAA